MKYAFNTWPYSSFPVWVPSYPLEETIKRIAAIGYDGIEIGCAAPHAWPDFLPPDRRRALRSLMADVDLAPVSLLPAPGGGPGVNTASCLPEERAFAIRHYKDVVDLAADLGAGLVLYIAGWLSFGTSRLDGWAWSAEALREIGLHARERGISIAVEPTPTDSNLIETADDALELMREADLPNVKVMFDTFHALYRSEVPADYVRQMGEHLAHVHFADTDRGAPGDGAVDWTGVLTALRDVGFDGYCTMEIGFHKRAIDPDDIARRALAYVRELEANLPLR